MEQEARHEWVASHHALAFYDHDHVHLWLGVHGRSLPCYGILKGTTKLSEARPIEKGETDGHVEQIRRSPGDGKAILVTRFTSQQIFSVAVEQAPVVPNMLLLALRKITYGECRLLKHLISATHDVACCPGS